ncbi:unnamed protein product [Effrenium voratum]|nr:unnamed protein product [Effrenium voratum]
MNCTREEWCKVARVLVEKQILAPIDRESIFRVRGEPLLNGVFTVEKKGVAAPGVLLWSGDDQRGAYYAWALPADWRPFMAFRWQLGLSPVPAGAGLPPDWEWRRDRPVPGSAVAEGGGWIQYYLDDFDAPEFVDRTDWQRLRGILSATHRRQREAYARKGVGISQDKAHVRELAVTEPSGMVTCSDASLHGAGLCASAGLTQEGKAMLANVEAGDADKAAKRLLRRRWPGLIELGDISNVVFPLQGEHMENWGDYKELRVPLCREDASSWLDVNSVWNGESNGWLPALTCPHYRKQPNPSVMADLDLASQEAIRRWTEDHFRFPVSTYEAKNMVTGPDQALRLPSASEREALMGFDRGYITQAISPKCSPSEVLNLVGTLVGRSSHVCVITILLHSLLVQFGLEPVRNLEKLVAARQVASAGWLLYPRFVPRGLETPDTAQLVLHFIRQAEKGYVATDCNPSDIPSRWGGQRSLTGKDSSAAVPELVPAWEDLDTAVGAWLEHAYSEGAAVTLGFINEAAGLLVAFDCMLRSGELYTLKVKDVKFMRNRAVLNLNQSKAGKRAGHSEMVVVESRLAFKWLKQACSGRSKEERLLSKGPAFFRKLFHAMTGFFNAEGLLTVYSLRRGGATWDFLHHQSMERTLLRGRWSTAHTARIYLQDAVATVSHLQLTAEQRQLAHFLLRRLKP